MNTFFFKTKINNEFGEHSTIALGINDNIKKEDSLQNYLIKARHYKYKYFKIPYSFELGFELDDLVNTLKEYNLETVLLANLKSHLLSIELNPSVSYEFLLDSSLDQEELGILTNRLEFLQKRNVNFIITIVSHRMLYLETIVEQLLEFKDKLCIYFSPNYKIYDQFLNCSEINRITENSNLNLPHSPWQVLWDHRIQEDLELLPFYEPVIDNVKKDGEIECSLIIPSYNNSKYLRKTLKNLFNLNYSKNKFEIIILDDGSNDGTYEETLLFLKEYKLDFNFKYFYLPRFQRRIMGDARYRAGISRNFGSSIANGEYIFFLDSDIIVSPDYISDNINYLKSYDVVQSVRRDLTNESSTKSLLYNNINPHNDISDRDEYWIEFHSIKQDWDTITDKWKYLCTHSLCLHRSTLEYFGNFEKNFIFYGFEDTDLGYKLAKNQFKFFLNRKPVYHLYHQNIRSEFFNSSYLRKVLLTRTAQIFYLIHLDENIYSGFKDLMSPEFSILNLFKKLIRRIKEKVFWKWPIFQ